jgi:hypothetical protein
MFYVLHPNGITECYNTQKEIENYEKQSFKMFMEVLIKKFKVFWNNVLFLQKAIMKMFIYDKNIH